MSEPLQYIYVQTRSPRAGDGGAIAEGSYRVDGNMVILYDREGKTILDKREIVAPFNARETAAKMLKRRPSGAQSFNRPLDYSSLNFKY